MDKKQIIKKKIIHYMTKDQTQESLMRFKDQLIDGFLQEHDPDREHYEYCEELDELIDHDGCEADE